MKRLCILIPSYNEARTIGDIVRDLRSRDLVAYVVDDGSTDGTAAIAKAEGAIVIRHEKNRGKGAALRDGFSHILKDGFDAVLVMDADNQHDVTDIAHLIKRMRQTDADVVIGNRMHDTSSMPAIRVYVNRFMSDLISRLAHQEIPDTQSGFRLIKAEVLNDIVLESSN